MAEEKKKKKSGKKGLMAILTVVLIPLIIIVLLASIFFAIIDAIIGIITGIIGAIIDIISDPLKYIRIIGGTAFNAVAKFFNINGFDIHALDNERLTVKQYISQDKFNSMAQNLDSKINRKKARTRWFMSKINVTYIL